jgi:hypothetical protein
LKAHIAEVKKEVMKKLNDIALDVQQVRSSLVPPPSCLPHHRLTDACLRRAPCVCVSREWHRYNSS